MMHAHGFDHATDVLGASGTDPAAVGEPAAFEFANGTEIVYTPGKPDEWLAIERPTAGGVSAGAAPTGPSGPGGPDSSGGGFR